MSDSPHRSTGRASPPGNLWEQTTIRLDYAEAEFLRDDIISAAADAGLKVGLGPIVDSPVGAMTLRGLLDRFARAALFGASMNGIGESVQYAVLVSYWLTLLAAIATANWVLLAVTGTLAAARVAFASLSWTRPPDLLGDPRQRSHPRVLVRSTSLTKRIAWGGIEYRVLHGGKMQRVDPS